jgi:hypothetical protein
LIGSFLCDGQEIGGHFIDDLEKAFDGQVRADPITAPAGRKPAIGGGTGLFFIINTPACRPSQPQALGLIGGAALFDPHVVFHGEYSSWVILINCIHSLIPDIL